MQGIPWNSQIGAWVRLDFCPWNPKRGHAGCEPRSPRDSDARPHRRDRLGGAPSRPGRRVARYGEQLAPKNLRGSWTAGLDRQDHGSRSSRPHARPEAGYSVHAVPPIPGRIPRTRCRLCRCQPLLLSRDDHGPRAFLRASAASCFSENAPSSVESARTPQGSSRARWHNATRGEPRDTDGLGSTHDRRSGIRSF